VQLNARAASNDLARFTKDSRLDEPVRQRAASAVQQLGGKQ
jgi:hypothetical protein